MLATKYRVRNRVMSGVQVLGYDVADNCSNRLYRLNKEDFNRLALNNQIIDVHAQTSNGKVYCKGINGLRLKDLNTVNITRSSEVDLRFSIRSKIKFPNNRSIVGFLVDCYDKKTRVITTQQAKLMASEGKIKNLRVNKVKDNQILRGIGCNLAEVPTITLTPEEFSHRLAMSNGVRW